MSIRTVQRDFKAMTGDLKLTNREARELMNEARKGGVTVGEAQLIGSLAKRAVTGDPRLARITKDGFFASASTVKEMERFATAHGSPLPTAEQMRRLYTGLASERLSSGGGTSLSGPPVSNPNDFPSWNMTPEGLQDVTRTLFLINDKLIFRTSGWGPRGITSQWTDLGPAPQFAPKAA